MKQQPSFLKKILCLVSALLMFATSAFATPTALSTTPLKINGSVNAPVTAGSLTVAFTACDAVNGNSFVATGQEILLVNNTGGSSYTFTVSSIPDSLNRLDTSLTAYSVTAGTVVAVQMKNLTGWQQSGGTINLTCSNASLTMAVIKTS